MTQEWHDAEMEALIDCYIRVQEKNFYTGPFLVEMSEMMPKLVARRRRLQTIPEIPEREYTFGSIVQKFTQIFYQIGKDWGPYFLQSKAKLLEYEERERFLLFGIVAMDRHRSDLDHWVWRERAWKWADHCCYKRKIDLRDIEDYTAEFCRNTFNDLYEQESWQGFYSCVVAIELAKEAN